MPFENTWSPLKLTRGDSKGLRCFGSNFIYWNDIMYFMSAEFLLSTQTLLVLYPSMVSMITRGSSCGCLTPLASRSEKNNVFISSVMMFGYQVFYMNTVDLSLNWLSKRPI